MTALVAPRRVAVTLEQCWHRVPGGTARATLGLVRALAARRDLDVVGVAGRHRRPPAPWEPAVPVRQLPLSGPLLYEAWHRLRWPPVQRATGPVDVVHATSLAVPPRSAPLVVTIHDLAFLRRPEHFTAQGRRFLQRGYELARRADLLLCPSRATLDDCAAHGFPSERLRLVPWGVDAAPASEPDVDRVRRRYGLDRPYVLSVGTAEPRKNLGRLLEAFAGVDGDTDLVIVGPAGWGQGIEQVAGSTEHVRLLGFVPDADLPALYALARVFCYPSLLEGFGLPVLEAMAQGTPVVTSAGTSTAELAGDGAGVLVDPTDPAAIAAGIESVLQDEGAAARLSDAGRARAAQYTWDRAAALAAAAYAEVAP